MTTEPSPKRLLFRRQFLLGPKAAGKVEDWKETALDADCWISSHPDLEVSKVARGETTLVLLGYLLDPFHPRQTGEQILENIIEEIKVPDDVFPLMASTGGRYVMVIKVKNSLRIFTDPAGFRQLFYGFDQAGKLWCSSQPALLANELGLERDAVLEEDLFRLPLFKFSTEYWFPGNTTLIKGVVHLTPNHYLDLRTGEPIRFWPKASPRDCPIEEALERCAIILNGILRGAVERFDLAFAITAGLDTRVLLAAAKEVRDRIYFFTHTHERLNETGPDIDIPRQMLGKFGAAHHIVQGLEMLEPEFEAAFRQSVTAARTRIGKNALAIKTHFDELQRKPLVVNGFCGEITRSYYRLPQRVVLSGKVLATLAGMAGSESVEKAFGQWLEAARAHPQKTISLLDLFYWENRTANWGAMSYSEYDIAFDSLSPFNCREVIELLLGVDSKLRLPPDYEIHRALIQKMWPELLDFPINPPANFKERILGNARKTPFYDWLRYAKFSYRLWRQG